MTWEEFIAGAEREMAKLADAGETYYNMAEGILRALHERITALEGKAAAQPEDDATVQPQQF